MNETGRYRIQSVADMTGISAATLRAWERRYGIPTPQRSAAAYRLYTDRDVEMIRLVRQLCEDGVAPAQAAEMIRVSRASRTGRGGVEEVHHETDSTELAVQKILVGVERFDADMLEAAVRHAMLLVPAAALFDRVLGPVLVALGERWRSGAISVGQEHLASEIIAAALRDILRLLRPSAPARTVLLACFADEEHTLPLIGVALTLAGWNMRSVLLGARTPASAIRHAVAEIRPDMVGLSVTSPVPSDRAVRLIGEYAEACGRTPWLVGGQGAGELHGLIEARGGAVAPGDRTELRSVLDRLMMAWPDDALSSVAPVS